MFDELNMEQNQCSSDKLNNVLVVRGYPHNVAEIVVDNINWYLEHELDVKTLRVLLIELFNRHLMCSEQLIRKTMKDVERHYPALTGKLV